jgi:hypothetical protein
VVCALLVHVWLAQLEDSLYASLRFAGCWARLPWQCAGRCLVQQLGDIIYIIERLGIACAFNAQVPCGRLVLRIKH